jgi:hypothetical protein
VNTTLQHLAIRPFVGLLAAFVLATSAVVAVSAETHAVKPTPTVAYDSNEDCGPYGSKVRITANFKITSKGHWVNVTYWLKGGVQADYDWDNPSYSERTNRHALPDAEGGKLFKVDTLFPDGPHDGAVWIALTDRVGSSVDDAESTPNSCAS